MQIAIERPTLILELGAEPTPLFPTQKRVLLTGDLHHVVPPADLEHTVALRNLLPMARYAEWATALPENAAIRVVVMLDNAVVYFTDDIDPREWDLTATLQELLVLCDRHAGDLEDLPALLPQSLSRCDHCAERYDPERGLKCPRCGAPTTPFKRPLAPSSLPPAATADVAASDTLEAELTALTRDWPTPLQPFFGSDHVCHGQARGAPLHAARPPRSRTAPTQPSTRSRGRFPGAHRRRGARG